MILYKFNQDGMYSSIEKHEFNDGLAKELISQPYPEYFKSFSKAKSELKNYIKRQINDWRLAMDNCKELKETDLQIFE